MWSFLMREFKLSFMCGKKIFDKRGAKSALNWNASHPRKRRKEKRMYYCRVCKAWHLTSKEDGENWIEEIEIIEPERWRKLMSDD